MPPFLIKTFGCKLNQYESQLIRENLIKSGLRETKDLKDAGYLIINSCAVTADSVKGLRKYLRSSIKANPNLRVIIVGCLVSVYPEQLKDLPGIYLSLDNNQKFKLAQILRGDEDFQFQEFITYFEEHTRAYVKVQDGCDNRCSYCCVWMARGKPRSRDLSQILEEVRVLVEKGYKEIVLTGLCLGSFGKDMDYPFVRLLEEIEAMEGDFRMRLSSIEPQDVNEELIDHLRISRKLVPHLHIPLQSGSDRVLKLMGRKYSVGYFKELIGKLKGISNFQFSTDVMVGFPGEEEEDFKMSLDLLRQLSPIRVHIFPYSPRPRTKAYYMEGRVPSRVIWERKKRMQEVVREVIRKNLEGQIGKTFTVLFEEKVNDMWLGYTENYIRTGVCSEENLANQFRKVKITSMDPCRSLAYGELNEAIHGRFIV